MNCVHKVRWSVKRPENCRFRLSVSHYKDRIVAPDEYSGATEVTPTDSEQALPTTDKLVRDDITVLPAPTEYLSTDHNGTFTPSDGKVGFSQVNVDVQPDLQPLSISENGTYQPDGFDGYSDVTVDVEPNLTSLAVTENGLYLPESGTDGFDRVSVDVPAPDPVLQGKAVNPSETAQHVTADSGYDGLSAVDVGAIPSSYVGTGITRRSASDLTASGNTVSVPSGYYAESGSKSVQSGTAGTPTASKSAVSNNAVTVTPSVSNSEGYISGGTKTGNAVTVSASELVSGTENIVANGTYDVVNKASAVVNVPSQAPVLDSLSVTANGTYTPSAGIDGFNEVNVDVPTGGGGGLTLLDTIDVNGVNGVQTGIDMSWFDTYDYVMMVPDLTFSANDWPYIVSDATTGGAYADRMTSMGINQCVYLSVVNGTLWGAWFRDAGNRPQPYAPTLYLYWHLYSSSSTMTGTIKIYGIKISA